MENIKWTIMHVGKKDLDGWVAKKLMRITLKNDVWLELSSGAEDTLRRRRKELSPNTLKLVALSNLRQLVHIMLQVFSYEHLEMLANSPKHDVLTSLHDNETFQKLVPLMLEHKDELDEGCRAKIIKLGGQEACEKYKDLKFMQETILRSKHCPLQLFYNLTSKHPKYLEGEWIAQKLGIYVAKGKLKVINF